MRDVGCIFTVSIIMYLLVAVCIYSFDNKVDAKTDNEVVAKDIKEETTTEKVLRENPHVDGPVPVMRYEEPETPLTKEEIDLIALITMAEAEGECEYGKRLVIDTVLNRVDSPYFPDTVNKVIYQTNAFESLYNGRVDRCYVMDSIVKLVKEEAAKRTNYDVVFFCAGDYSIYGTPLFKVGNHYFSKYEGE